MLRPQADKKKISYKDDFELCYLRHRYLRRVDYNPTEEEMSPYMDIVRKQSLHTFYVYNNLFKTVGFEAEDMVNVGRVFLTEFIGLFSLEKMDKKHSDFVNSNMRNKGAEPTSQDILNKNKADVTTFLKQRLQDFVRICKQKARDIKGVPTNDFYAYYGKDAPPSDLRLLVEDHVKFGFRKIDPASFRTIRKRMKVNSHNKPFEFAGLWYVSVIAERRTLSSVDFTGADMDPYDNIHNKDPERLLLEKDSEENFHRKRKNFKRLPVDKQLSIMRDFINGNANNPRYAKEVNLARDFITRKENSIGGIGDR